MKTGGTVEHEIWRYLMKIEGPIEKRGLKIHYKTKSPIET